jgi:hypothetical protein
MLLRLTVSGGGTMAQGEVSFDGVHWTSLGRQSFASPLRYQGLAVSAHDTGTAIRFLALPVGAQGPPLGASRRRRPGAAHRVRGRVDRLAKRRSTRDVTGMPTTDTQRVLEPAPW